jgi:L-ascorbate metabolism protein UlaG (beta-lactamase superfamily)
MPEWRVLSFFTASHFDGKRFFNPGSPQARGFLDAMKWQLSKRQHEESRFLSDVTPSKPPADVVGPELRVTLVNHSTVLLQQNGINILTDPIWAERASPFTWIGPRRRRMPGVLFEDLPRIDLVLLTHNHYDHLDLATLRRLAAAGHSRFVVPLGVARLLRSQNIGPLEAELDWGGSVTAAGVTVHSAPALHFSARGAFDRNRTLWCGYVIETAAGTVYFAGDTGFGGLFEDIRERFGPPRLALLPIGAYEPRWFMSPIHMGPDEAVRAHRILGAATSIAIHHGTFALADDGIDTPRRVLAACNPGDSFVVLDNGQSLVI